MYTNEISIGGVRIPNRLVLGPMAGVTDRPFRTICHELGAGLVSMEMVSANAVKYGNKKTFDLIHIDPDEHPISMQLFGPDPDTMVLAAKALDAVPYDILDVNMGCPMPKIVNNGEGSALMKDPETAAAIIRELVHFQSGKSRPADVSQTGTGGTVPSDESKTGTGGIALSDESRTGTGGPAPSDESRTKTGASFGPRPVTVKIRAGFDRSHLNAVELAEKLAEAGAAAIAVHGRTREQYYTGQADWDVIRQVKEAVPVPVIGNGDVTSPEKAVAMFQQTGCDLVMIARGARGNPWLFRDIDYFIRTGRKRLIKDSVIDADTSFSDMMRVTAEMSRKEGRLFWPGEHWKYRTGDEDEDSSAVSLRDAAGSAASADEDSSAVSLSAAPAGGKNSIRPSAREVYDMMLRHARMQLEEKGDYLGICQMRKHIAWYTTGLPGSAALRAKINACNTLDALKETLDAWLASTAHVWRVSGSD